MSSDAKQLGHSHLSDAEDLIDDASPKAGTELQPVELARLRRGVDKQRAILNSMREGVMAVDSLGDLIFINRAALNLLGPTARGGELARSESNRIPAIEIIRHAGLQRFIARALKSNLPFEETLVVDLGESERYLQAFSRALEGIEGGALGVLIELTDVTRVKHLETLRRDFVANVSHELKTPITSIKGFVETLLDGAVDNPDDARRFLNIISRQADRLNAIFEDLLSLSRIEQEKERGGIKLEERSMLEIIEGALQSCHFTATERRVRVVTTCAANLKAFVHATLLEQAVVNLIDNAVKFSEEGTEVTVAAQEVGNEVQIVVQDQGRGIDKAHLPRIFERFYRVERSRSRREGGTGLGLAIVKHIAQAHGGYASVESDPGKGSRFCIHLQNGSQPPGPHARPLTER